MRAFFLRGLLVVSIGVASGCGLTLDLSPADPDAATPSFDAGAPGPDAARDGGTPLEDGGEACEHGTQCPLASASGVCIDGACMPSTCGDGVRDPRSEDCDDGNAMNDDVCPSDCRLACETQLDCPIAESPCLGAVACVAGRCEQPSRPDGTPCTGPSPGDAECRAGRCAPRFCGNGAPDIGEQCDDANTIPGDGCEADCRFSCEADVDCDDGVFCTGIETCERTSHTCVRALRQCPMGDECVHVSCVESEDACISSDIDFDFDGHLCATDCAPADRDIHPGITEICNGRDDDCDERIDEGVPGSVACFVDADHDGFGADGSGSVRCACRPDEVTVGGDCYDHATDLVAAMVRPSANVFRADSYTNMDTGETSFDWNCMNGEEPLFTRSVGLGGEVPPCDAPTAPGTCSADPLWASDAIPSCGGAGDLLRCVPELLSCVRQRVEGQLQRCR